jgi:hypothetical protein
MKLCIGLFSDVLVYWRGGGQLDSVSKLRVLNDVCTSIGVTTTATKLNGVWIVPLLSWYHQSFDKEKDIEGFNIRPPEKVFLL